MNLRCLLAMGQLLSAFYAVAYTVDKAMTAEIEKNVAPEAEDGLCLVVPRALPLHGQQHILVARIRGAAGESREGVVSFHCQTGKTTSQIGSDHHVRTEFGKEDLAIAQPWTPQHTGEHTLIARIRPGGARQWRGLLEATQTVTVVKRSLHFHHWHLDPSLKYATEGMMNDVDKLDYWRTRGVRVQRWTGGIWAYKTKKVQTPQALAVYWSNPLEAGWPGIVIDEFGAGGEVDEILGQALIETRKRSPGIYLAPYTVSAGGEQKMRGLRDAADRVLVETYCSHGAYGYSTKQKRVEAVIEHVREDKLLAALAFGEWITTPQELRRQLHFTRYTFPRMPGVAFFHAMQPTYSALNEHLRHFYVDPVVRAEVVGEGQVRFENIGGADSPAIQAQVRAQGPPPRILDIDVPALGVGESHVVSVSGKDLQPVTAYRDGCFVLGPPLLWDKEPAEHRPGATTAWPAAPPIAGSVRLTFAEQPKLKLQYDTSGKPGYDGNVSGAIFPVPPTEERSFELQFDLETIRTWFYGSIQVSLVSNHGKSKLDLNLYRGDHEPGPYFQLSVTNEDGIIVRERMAYMIEPRKNYRLIVRYKRASYVRVAIQDRDSNTLWDTGEIPISGSLQLDQLRLSVRSGPTSDLRWDEEHEAMFLRGTIGPKYPLSGYVDNVEVSALPQLDVGP